MATELDLPSIDFSPTYADVLKATPLLAPLVEDYQEDAGRVSVNLTDAFGIIFSHPSVRRDFFRAVYFDTADENNSSGTQNASRTEALQGFLQLARTRRAILDQNDEPIPYVSAIEKRINTHQ